MEKIIKLVMNEKKSIQIFVNDVSKYTIEESEREISAKMIYELLDYTIGDKFSILSENKKNVDASVLDYFKDLFENICVQVNEMDTEEDDIVSKIAVDSDTK